MKQFVDQSGTFPIHVDAGNYFKPLGPTSNIINELMRESLSGLPLRVLNLAPGDLHVWKQLHQAGHGACQIISTNLVPEDRTLPAPPRYAIVEVQPVALSGGKSLRIAFLGVSDPRDVRPNSGFKGADVNQAVAEAIGELQGQTDLVVVLADLSEEQVTSLAQSQPEIDLIVRAERKYLRREPRVINRAVVVSSVERARYLGQMVLKFDDSGRLLEAEPELVEMRAGVPEDSDFLRREEAVNGRLP